MNIAWRKFTLGENAKKLCNRSKKMKSQEQKKVISTKLGGNSHTKITQNLHNQQWKKEI